MGDTWSGNGITQHLCLDNSYYEHNKNYVGANIDAMVNLSTLFAGANPSRFLKYMVLLVLCFP